MAPNSPQLQPERTLRWEGCCNIRDLGGLPLEDGGETRFGVVVRADDVSLLSEAGWQAAEQYGVRRIVDLRHEDEPYDAPIELVRVPLLNPPAIAEVDELFLDISDSAEWRRLGYLFFLDRFSDRFARAVNAVAEPADGPVLIHCAGGVDRTGLLAALILRVTGVGIDAIAADYAESEANWAPTVDGWIEDAPDEAERKKRTLLSVMPPEAMRDTLANLEREHGNIRRFLTSAGVDEPALDGLRDRLRG